MTGFGDRACKLVKLNEIIKVGPLDAIGLVASYKELSERTCTRPLSLALAFFSLFLSVGENTVRRQTSENQEESSHEYLKQPTT